MSGPYPIRAVSKEEERRMREEFDEFLKSNRNKGSKRSLHLIGGDGRRLCFDEYKPNNNYGFRRVSAISHPMGHFEICRHCRDVWSGRER